LKGFWLKPVPAIRKRADKIAMETDVNAVESNVVEAIKEMLEDLDLDTDLPLDRDTQLIADVGFASVDFIHLIVVIEGRFHRKFGFHELIMPNGKYVSDLRVGKLVDFIHAKLAGETAGVSQPATAPPVAPELSEQPVIGPRDVETFLTLMPSLEKWGDVPPPATRNAPAAFLLSSPRSGSTLLRVLLAGNPALFAPPELHLLYFADMAQRRQALANKWNEHLLSGTVRAVMQLRSCSSAEAEEFVRSCEDRRMPTHEFYAALQGFGGARLLVDKTPTYAVHTGIMQRAERDFQAPLYIHLVRHPCGMIRSFEDARMEQLVPFMRDSDFTARQTAELAWLLSNRNVAEFLGTVPRERWLRVRYEDLVREPETWARKLSEFLGVPFAPAMLDLYEEQEAKMTDGLGAAAQRSGDLKFYLHDRIDPEAADRWKKFVSEKSLSEMSRQLATELGYTLSQ
jgi:acyl carrier protein